MCGISEKISKDAHSIRSLTTFTYVIDIVLLIMALLGVGGDAGLPLIIGCSISISGCQQLVCGGSRSCWQPACCECPLWQDTGCNKFKGNMVTGILAAIFKLVSLAIMGMVILALTAYVEDIHNRGTCSELTSACVHTGSTATSQPTCYTTANDCNAPSHWASKTNESADFQHCEPYPNPPLYSWCGTVRRAGETVTPNDQWCQRDLDFSRVRAWTDAPDCVADLDKRREDSRVFVTAYMNMIKMCIFVTVTTLILQIWACILYFKVAGTEGGAYAADGASDGQQIEVTKARQVV